MPAARSDIERVVSKVVIAVARDAAFSFYYEDNLSFLRESGAEVVFFSPQADAALPEGTTGLYFGGGFPEIYAHQLAANEPLLAALDARGIRRASVTLHVGAGTFQPMKTEVIAEHRMHSERYAIPPATVAAIEACRARGGRVLAVGTTTVRTLESWAQSGKTTGDTNIFITPGFSFKVVDVLITNFHLPKSTLMMLVSAFAGYAHIMGLYRHAIAQRYRFFSYGDAMLLERAKAAN